MQMIFSYGSTISKFTKGSGDPLGSQPDFSETQESETIILDGPDKPQDAQGDRRGRVGGKRKRGALGNDEI